MRVEFRTLMRTVGALVIGFTLVAGMSLDAFAQGKRGKRQRVDQGRHLGWEKGRRMSDERRGRDWNRSHRRQRRGERFERRELSRHQKLERRELKSHQKAERRALKSHQRSERRTLRRDRRF